MKRLTKCGVFLALLCLFGAGAALLFRDLGAECLSVLGTGFGDGNYLLVSAGADGGVYALSRKDGAYQLVTGDQAGRRTGSWKLPKDVLPSRSRPVLLYPAAGGAVYLGLYNTEKESAQLQLYRFTEQGRSAELLLSEPCYGGSLPEQMASVRLSDFSEVNSMVTFAVIQGEQATFYQRASAGGGLEKLQTVTEAGLRTALALPDATMALVTGSTLIRTDREPVALPNGEIVTQMNQAGTGIYYIDGASLSVFFADFAEWRPYAYLDLEKDAYDLDRLTDLRLTRDGSALLLLDGRRLLLDRGSNVFDMSGMLYRPVWQCVLILAGLALGVLLLTFILWYLACEQRKLRMPLLLRWGVIAAAAAVLGVGGVLRLAVEPACRAAAEREASGMLGSISALRMEGNSLTDPRVPQLLSGNAAGAAGDLYWDTVSEVYRRNGDGTWTLFSGSTGLPAGVRAELSPTFDREQAEKAWNSGSARWTRQNGGGTRFVFYRAQGSYVLSADADGARLLEEETVNYDWMVRALWALAVLLTAITIAILCRMTFGVRRILEGMERLAAGDRHVEVRLSGGDELKSLAEDVNAMSDAIRKIGEQSSDLARSYRRFVPERVLSLLGKDDIAQVDKSTSASRHLAAMMLTFRFPAQVYTRSGRELFDNVNEIIERTASIIAAKGGAVFNLTYNGYDAVFEGGSALAVSTAVAVQQEVLVINREREDQGRPLVSVRIALDEGSVMLGVVGDKDQLQPASISASFSVARHLIELGERLEANILCTEAVLGGIRDYASRYIGKCVEGGIPVRIYEIFDGDPYEIRKVKEQTSARFSEGVYALYGRDLSRAKSIFLSLVHCGTGDGGARYYLYLADRLEKQPEGDISLDSGV